jgi:hypothetical protein
MSNGEHPAISATPNQRGTVRLAMCREPPKVVKVCRLQTLSQGDARDFIERGRQHLSERSPPECVLPLLPWRCVADGVLPVQVRASCTSSGNSYQAIRRPTRLRNRHLSDFADRSSSTVSRSMRAATIALSSTPRESAAIR